MWCYLTIQSSQQQICSRNRDPFILVKKKKKKRSVMLGIGRFLFFLNPGAQGEVLEQNLDEEEAANIFTTYVIV